MSLQRQAVRGVAWAFVAKSSGRIISTLVLVVLARLLAPEDFGLVALAAVFVGLLTLVRDSGFAAALVHKRDLDQDDLSTAFWTSVALGVLLAAVTTAAAGPLSDVLGTPELAPVLRVLGLTFVLGALRTVPGALLTRRMDFRAMAVRNVVGTCAGGAAGIGAALAGAGAWALVAQALVDVVAELVVVALKARWTPSLRWSRTSFRALTGFSLRVLGGQVLNYASRRSDDLLVGAFLGPVALGLYSVAYRLLRVVLELCVETLNMVVLPTLSRLQDDAERRRRAFDRALEAAATVCVPAFALLGTLAPELVELAFGPRWAAAAPLMAVLAAGGVAQTVYMLQVQALIASGEVRWSLRLSTVNGLVSLLAFAVAVQHGVLAVAVAFTVRALAVVPVGFAVTSAVLGLSFRSGLRVHVGPVVASAGMVLVLEGSRRLLPDTGSLAQAGALLLVCLLGAGVYAGLLRTVAPQQTRRLLGLVSTLRSGAPRPAPVAVLADEPA